MLVAASVVNTLNPWAILASSLVALWLFIWGGIRLWHRRAATTLEEKFKPYFDEIKTQRAADQEDIKERLDHQDLVLGNVEHEVTYNSGESLKDRVKEMGDKVSDVIEALTTDDPTALNPFPRLGVIDTQRVQGEAIGQIGRDVTELKQKAGIK